MEQFWQINQSTEYPNDTGYCWKLLLQTYQAQGPRWCQVLVCSEAPAHWGLLDWTCPGCSPRQPDARKHRLNNTHKTIIQTCFTGTLLASYPGSLPVFLQRRSLGTRQVHTGSNRPGKRWASTALQYRSDQLLGICYNLMSVARNTVLLTRRQLLLAEAHNTSQKNSFPLREQNQDIQETSSELLICDDRKIRGNKH